MTRVKSINVILSEQQFVQAAEALGHGSAVSGCAGHTERRETDAGRGHERREQHQRQLG